MSPLRRGAQYRAPLILLCLACLPACERGCLWRALTSTEERTAPGGAWLGLNEVDCPDGLARCSGGVVQTSVGARRPSPCHGTAEACACPWTVADRCPDGLACVADGLELPAALEMGVTQLCSPSPLSPPVARPAAADAPLDLAETRSCDGEAFACVGSHVVACTPAARVVGTCAKGCASETGLGGALAERLNDRQASAILCAR